MKALDKISTGINHVVSAAAVVFLVLMLGASTIQVISRYIFNSSVIWTEELARYCFIWMNMLAVSVLVKSGGHAVVDLFSKLLKGKVKRVYRVILDLAMMYIGVVFARFGWQLVNVVKKQKSPAMHISMAYVYSAVVVCGVLVCLHQIVAVLHEITSQEEGVEN